MKVSTQPPPLLAFLVGFGALVWFMVWSVGWVLPLVLLSIIVMVIGHEFGHFISAKRSGMLVTDFFVGFGPILWSRTIGETRYGLRALLLGGYVKVPGMTWQQEVTPEIESRTYRSASYPRKVFFASAGSIMHVVMALILSWSALVFIGVPSSSHIGVSAFEKWDGYSMNAAQRAGMHVGDQLVAIDGTKVRSVLQLIQYVHSHANTSLSLTVLRNGRDKQLHVTPIDGRKITISGTPLASGSSAVGYLGVALNEPNVPVNAFSAVGQSFSEIGSTFKSAVVGTVHVFTPAVFTSLFHQVASSSAAANPKNQSSRPQSIVGIVRIAVQGTQTSGFGVLLRLLVAVNIFFGVLNMLPMLPLDGGYVAVATYERLRSRRGSWYRADINKLAPVVYAFVSVLFVLFSCTLYLDIVHPITNPF